MRPYLSKVFAFTFVLANLAACGGGGDDAPPPYTPTAIPPPVSVPQPDYGQLPNQGYDYVGQYVVPQLQAIYGDIEVLGPISIVRPDGQLENLQGKTLTWAQVYNDYLRGLAVRCGYGCYSDVPGIPSQTGSGFRGWAEMDYAGFSGYLEGGFGYDRRYYQDWLSSDVVRLRNRGELTSFAAVISTLIYSNYSVYSVYYQNYYPQQYPGNGGYVWGQFGYGQQYGDSWNRQYGYRPYGNSAYGGFQYSDRGGDSNWNLSVGGFINF